MNILVLKARVDTLYAMVSQQRSLMQQNTLYHGTLGIMQALYGPDSSQEKALRTAIERFSNQTIASAPGVIDNSIAAIGGVLAAIKAELDSGFIGHFVQHLWVRC